ncbi:unnamed protein product, partial [Musa textilis]
MALTKRSSLFMNCDSVLCPGNRAARLHLSEFWEQICH